MLFLSLQIITLQRSYNILEWINSWWVRGYKVTLTPDEWFIKGKLIMGKFTQSEGHRIPVTKKQGLFKFIPPPTVGYIAIEEL